MGYCACCGRLTLVGCGIAKHEAHVYSHVMVEKGYSWDSQGNLIDTKKV